MLVDMMERTGLVTVTTLVLGVEQEDLLLHVGPFLPEDLLQELGLSEQDFVGPHPSYHWKQLVGRIAIDWNASKDCFRAQVLDCPEKGLVVGKYRVPEVFDRIEIRLTDIASTCWTGRQR